MDNQTKKEYWDIVPIMSYGADYNVVIGERSNGKTYGVLKEGLERYLKNGTQMAIIRRWDTDFVGVKGQQLFESLETNGDGKNAISELSNGEWTNVLYYGGQFTLYRLNEKKQMVKDNQPFAFAFGLNVMEHFKSLSYPNVNFIVFDEFISRNAYLKDEFVVFSNMLSTIIRQRDGISIWMLGNTVNKFCPYFKEMGFKHIKEMKQGTIDLYTYGESGLKVAVEYCKEIGESKASNKYFAFDNAKLNMIKSGAWELDIYPHCPVDYVPSNVLLNYFIKFDGELLHAECVSVGDMNFTFIHRKTTPIKDDNNDLVFDLKQQDARPNHRTNLFKPYDKVGKLIARYFQMDLVFYQDNEVGEVVRNYMLECKKTSVV